MKKNFFLLLCTASIIFANAQSVSINNTGTPAASSAMLDISSSSKGLLIPRMTKAQRNLIAAPKNGLMVYDSSSASFWFYKQNKWQEMTSNIGVSDSSLNYGQTGALASYNLNATIHNTILSDTSGFLYDSGGPAGNYSNNEDYTVVINSAVANVIGYKIQVISNSLENPFDSLFISSISPIGIYTSTDTLTGTETGNYSFNNGFVLIRFKTNATNTAAGFKIRWDFILPSASVTTDPLVAGWHYTTEKLAMHGGFNDNNLWSKDNSGFFSLNYGYGNSAKGDYSAVLGYYNKAYGKYAIALGNSTIATGENSISMGYKSLASGITSVAWGEQTTAQGKLATAFGRNSFALGELATTWGSNTIASGYNSTAFGSSSSAGNNNAVAWGNFSNASGYNSTAFGDGANASGSLSIAMGVGVIASGDYSIAMGSRISTNAMQGSFALGDATIGIGTLANDLQHQMLMRFEGGYKLHLNNETVALAIKPDGNIGVGTNSPLARFHVSDSSVIFSAVGNTPGSFGTPAIQGAGRRLFWYPDKAAFRVGYVDGTQWNKDSIGKYSFAAGFDTRASGEGAVAMGVFSSASGYYSTAFGYNNAATGFYSVSLGQNSKATTVNSTALGYNTIASGNTSTAIGSGSIAAGTVSIAMGNSAKAASHYTVAIGESVTANCFKSIALGSFNDPVVGIETYAWTPTEPILIVGNGIDASTRSNALTILKNGNTGIGVNAPTYKLHVGNAANAFRIEGPATTGGIAMSIGGNGDVSVDKPFNPGGRFIIKENGNTGIGNNSPNAPLAFANATGRKISLYDGGSNNYYGMGVESSQLQIYTDGSGAKISFGYYNAGTFTERMYLNNSTGTLTVNGTNYPSDARYKKQISPLQNPLQKIMSIKGVEYFMRRDEFPAKHFDTKLQVGLIAQDVEKVLPQAVQTDNEGYKSVDYAKLVPLLVEGMKEQQGLIASQQKQIDIFTTHDKEQQKQIDELKKLVDELIKK